MSRVFPAARRPDWLLGLTRALLAVAALLAGVWLYARWHSPQSYYGTPYPDRPAAANFTATDQNGRSFSLSSARGQAVALFFGFTHCPDICPLTLRYLQKARAALPASQQDRLRVVFVSLDPARDTPAQLGAYVKFFGGAVTALNLPEPRLAATARAYGVAYAKADVHSSDDYYINHTAATYLIDPAGRLRLVWDYSQLPQVDKVARDLRAVLGD